METEKISLAISEKEQPEQEELEKFERFFETDQKIKTLLIDSAPSQEDNFNEQARVEYSDKLYKNLGEMTYGLKTMMRDYYESPEIDKTLLEIQESTIYAGADFDKMQKVYKEKMTDMREDFSKEMHERVFGYSIASPHEMDKNAHSINEILHLIHFSVTNDEKILQKMPLLDSMNGKSNKDKEVYLRGKENDLARKIFTALSDEEVDIDQTDIVGLDDRVLMMVRGRGHALTLDVHVQKNLDRYSVNYFIPTVINANKVNNLPGVRKVSNDAKMTTGNFLIEDVNSASEQIAKFIQQVPTDEDMENLFLYNQNNS